LALLGLSVVVVGALGVALLFAIITLRSFLYICRPNEVLVLSGRTQATGDGGNRGYRVVAGGRAWRMPFIEKVDGMDLSLMPIDLNVTNAYSRGGIPLKIHAIANVKISADPDVMMNAIERFLGRERDEIRRVAKESLEGHLRGVLAKLTPEEVNEDRLKFAHELLDEADDDLRKLGLQLDTLKIQNVWDDVKYLDSIGRERIANVLMVADIAESSAKAEAERSEANFRRDAQVTVQEAETAVVKAENDLRRVKAELDGLANVEEERTTQIAAQARAEAEQELQEIRQRLEQTRLQADVVLPAGAAQRAEELRARGAAATIAENGQAGADALALLTETWLLAGKDAKDVFLIQQIEQVIRSVAGQVAAVEVGEVVLVDGGDGKALANLLAGYPAAVTAVLNEIHKSTGVDVIGSLNPRKEA
jgi:flotillin